MAEETKEKVKTEEKVETLDLKRFLSSMRLDVEAAEPVPMLQDELQTIAEDVSDEDRFISGLAALLMNIDTSVGRFDKGMAQERPDSEYQFQSGCHDRYPGRDQG